MRTAQVLRQVKAVKAPTNLPPNPATPIRWLAPTTLRSAAARCRATQRRCAPPIIDWHAPTEPRCSSRGSRRRRRRCRNTRARRWTNNRQRRRRPEPRRRCRREGRGVDSWVAPATDDDGLQFLHIRQPPSALRRGAGQRLFMRQTQRIAGASAAVPSHAFGAATPDQPGLGIGHLAAIGTDAETRGCGLGRGAGCARQHGSRNDGSPPRTAVVVAISVHAISCKVKKHRQ